MAHKRGVHGGLVLLASLVLVPNPTAAQTASKRDLSGIYSFSTITPLQRPEALSGKATLSEEEAVLAGARAQEK